MSDTGPDLSDLNLGHMKDEIQAVVLEKRDLLAHSRAKGRPREMIANTEFRLAVLEKIWLVLDRADRGVDLIVPRSASRPPQPPVEDKSGDLDDEWV